MLKKGSYIPWVSRFLRYIDGKKDYGKMLEDSIYNGPYKMKPIMDPRNTTGDPIVKPYPRLKKEEDLTGDDKKRFKADIDAMNAILLGIPNDIYNFVDACKTPQTMWQPLGWHLEEIHVNWAHLEKKRTRLQLYTKVDEEIAHILWRRLQKY
ncbi:hypothetical protein Tco_1508641 [Tanacetum coccineum]